MNEQSHLTIPEQLALKHIVQSRLTVFQGLCGYRKGKPVHLDIYWVLNSIVQNRSQPLELIRS